MFNKRIVARAPVRTLDLGGWTDTRLLEKGWVLNFGLKLYTYVILESIPDPEAFLLESYDIGESEYIHNIREMEYCGVLSLLKAAIKRTQSKGGLKLSVRSEAPPASGLGSSAALGVAAIGALNYFLGKKVLPYHVARLAHSLETEELKLECGVQDQLCAAYGGINYIEVHYPEARVFPVPISDRTICELESRMLVVYTGKSRFSSETHKKVIEGFQNDREGIKAGFAALSKTASLGLEALLRDNIEELAEATNLNWEAQKKLHPSITNDQIEDLYKSVFRNGAMGFKLNGAGAGGTACIICKRDCTHNVRRIIEERFPFMTVLNAKLDIGRCQGLQVWES